MERLIKLTPKIRNSYLPQLFSCGFFLQYPHELTYLLDNKITFRFAVEKLSKRITFRCFDFRTNFMKKIINFIL